ncbi:TPA: hypothetical protein ACSIXH_003645 [Acinetobacter baumannii]|uniref:hypothetical protein n=1 Tax=Staphylococcus TaxID=1279 RepID=UPI001950D91C|nr:MULTISPECIES: hypothetical protein [Staphylococcus]MEB7675192.1 hypothetical protein [Staphylococcus equorum]
MGNTQYKINNTDKVLNEIRKPLNLDDDIVDVLKQAVNADIKANMPKGEKSSGDKILELAKKNRLIKDK